MTYQNLRQRVFHPLRAEQPDAAHTHIVELDSLRGLAAMSVLLLHFLAGWFEASPPHFVNYIAYIPLLTNGNSAVILFFVLSGFVLTLPQMAKQPPSYPAYVARRVCRIYLPYLAALALAALGCWRFHGLDMYGVQFHRTWRTAPSLSVMASHIAFLGRYDVYAYNAPIWSLVHEMRISLIFPLLCLISLRLRARTAFFAALFLQFADRMIERYSGLYTGTGYPGVHAVFWADTVGFCGIFLLGSILARYRVQIVSWLAQLPVWSLSALLVAATVLYQYPHQLHIPHFLLDFTTAIGASGFVMLSLIQGRWLSRMLHLGPIRWLGKISYSLYLVHVPILLIMSILLYQKVQVGYLLVPFIALSLLVSAAFHRWVELPSMRLGRILARLMETRKTLAGEKRSAFEVPA